VGDAKAGENALLAGGVDALLHRGDEHAVHVRADQRLLELDAAVARARLDPQPDLGELAGTAGLFLVPVTRVAAAADGFTIGDVGFLEFDVDAEAAGQPLDDDLEMNLALAGDDRPM